MNRFANLTRLMALLLAVSTLAPPAAAQKKKVERRIPIEIRIVSVSKEDASAEPNPKGAGRLVPVKIQWKTGPWDGARLVELEAHLTTTNPANATAEVKKALQPTGAIDTLMLPMPYGVFAKEFKLVLTGKCSFNDKNGVSRIGPSGATKTGTFPLPAEK